MSTPLPEPSGAPSTGAIAELRGRLGDWRRAGDSLALVPTMGHLHEGHLALVRRARASARRVVVSIFVNPLQFDRAEDLERYPRSLERDLQVLGEAGVDLVFAPDTQTLYPQGESGTRVHVGGLSEVLEGAARPGHFSGVATVVSKLLNLVQPDVTVFGEKDYQQLLLVRRLVEDLSYSVEVMAVPTVREADGLALSSRNDLLDAAQRRQAPALHRALSRLVASVGEGVPVGALEARALAELQDAGLRPDYVALRRADDLAAPSGADGESLIALAAAWVGSVRLIDNLRVR